MGQSILQIILRVTKEGTGDKEAAKAAKDLKASLNDLGLGAFASLTPLAAVTAAVTGLAVFTGKAVAETVKYANEVRGLSQLTEQSAEESSRVLQVMDDLKVSYETLTMAAKTLSKDGLTLNMETLAQLSDEYRSLGSGAEKTRFLVEKFGKSGLGMAEAMEKGGAALRAMSEAVDESLILSQQSIDQARKYEMALDNLNDSWLALKVTVGNEAIPVMTKAVNAINAVTEDIQKNGMAWYEWIPTVMIAKRELQLLNEYFSDDSVDSATQSYMAMARALGENATPEMQSAEVAAKALADGFKQQLSVIGSMQSAEDSYAEKVRTLSVERTAIEAERAAAIAGGYALQSEKVREYDAALAENSAKAQENAAEHEKASKKIILGLLEQVLAQEGMTAQEMDYLLQKGQAWGLYSQKVIDEARKAIDEANAINNAINGIPSEKNVTINVMYSDPQTMAGGSAYQFTGGRGYASGKDGWETVPPGFPNDTYPAFLSSGEKFAVLPAGSGGGSRGGPGGAGGSVVNVYVSIPTMMTLANEHDLQERILPLVREGVRQVEAGR
jgi:hypothetical protein